MIRKWFGALRAMALASAVTIVAGDAAAQTNGPPELLPIGRILLRDALAAERAGTPRGYIGDLTYASVPAAWFPLPSCAFRGGLCGAIDRVGAPVIAPIYDWVDGFRKDRAIVRSGRLYGVVDATGRVVLPVEYDEIDVFSQDLLRIVRDGKMGLIDYDGHVVAEPRYDVVSLFTTDVLWLGESPTAAPSRPDSWIDARRRFIPGIFRSTLPGGFASIGGRATLIRPDGSVVRDFPHIEVRTFDAHALVWARTGTLWGLMKADGDWFLDPQFEDVQPLNGGLAAVKLNGTWGYADGGGHVVISARFDAPGRFVPGRNLGRQPDSHKREGLIDRNGEWVVGPRYEFLFVRFSRQSDGSSRQSDGGHWFAQHGSAWDILDDFGKLIAHIEGPLDQAPTLCADGRFQGLRNKEWILFDSQGRALAPPEGRLEFANCDQRLKVDAGGRFGVVDAMMRWIVPPRFEAITWLPGSEGRMLAKIDGKQGIMRADGTWLVEPVYQDLRILAADTFAAQRDGKYGALRIDGAWLIEPKYDDLRRLVDGRYAARIDGKYGVLLADGTWLVEPSFEDVKPLAESRIVARVGGLNGVYDMQANAWVMEPRSARMCGFQDRYALGITDGLRSVYDTRTGDILIGPRYHRLSLAFEAGLIAVRVEEKWGYADLSGNLVIPARFRNMGMFRRGIVWGDRGDKMCPMDRRGQWVEGISCVDPDPRELWNGDQHCCVETDAGARRSRCHSLTWHGRSGRGGAAIPDRRIFGVGSPGVQSHAHFVRTRLPAVIDAAKYSATETLRDGRRIEIRAIRPSDQADMLAAVEKSSAESLHRRFFGVKRFFTDKEIAYFLNVDFVDHVALVAVLTEAGRTTIVGGGRYVLLGPGAAEVAFAVVDDFQGQGIGAALMRHITAIARDAGLKELIAEVLPENSAMLKVFEKSGLRCRVQRESGTVHITLQLV